MHVLYKCIVVYMHKNAYLFIVVFILYLFSYLLYIMVKTYGNKDEVFDGEAMMTRGGLTKRDLAINARGLVVSKRQQANGRKNAVFMQQNRQQNFVNEEEFETDSE